MLKPIVRSILIASLAAGHAMAADSAAPGAAPVALHCPHLLDVVKGRTLGETTIIVESGRIRDVLPGFQTPAGATAIEYGLIAAGISLAIIAVMNGLGSKLNTKFTSINSSLK